MYSNVPNYGVQQNMYPQQQPVMSEQQLRAQLAQIEQNLTNPAIPQDVRMNLVNQREAVLIELRKLMTAMNQNYGRQQINQPIMNQGYMQQQTVNTGYQQQSCNVGFNRYSNQQTQQQVNTFDNTQGSRYANEANTQPMCNTQQQVQQNVCEQPVTHRQPINTQPVEQTIETTNTIVTKTTKGHKMKMNNNELKLKHAKDDLLVVLANNVNIVKGLLNVGETVVVAEPLLLPKDHLVFNQLLEILNPKHNRTLAGKAKAISALLNNTVGNDSKIIIEFNNYLTKLVNDYYSNRNIVVQIDSFIEDIEEVETGLDPIEIGDELYTKIDSGLSDIRAHLNGLYRMFSVDARELYPDGILDYVKSERFVLIPQARIYGKVDVVLEDNTYIPKDDKAYEFFMNLLEEEIVFTEWFIIDNNNELFVLTPAAGRINIKKV